MVVRLLSVVAIAPLVDKIDRADAMLVPSPCPVGPNSPLPTVFRISEVPDGA